MVKVTPNQERLAKLKFQQLTNAAYRAAQARDRFEQLLEKAKENKAAWERMCQVTGVSKNSEAGDWMC
jgi:ferric-dicitrate binding protein FerR (iron transport regulator)